MWNAAVIVFPLLVEILIPLMENVLAKDLADGTWVRTVSIRDHALWSLATCLEGVLEKARGSVHSAFLTEHGINQMAILLDGAIHGAPLSLDPHVGFSNVPGNPRLSATPHPHLISDHRSKAGLPIAHGCMRTRTTTFQEHLGKITYAQLLTQPLANDEQDAIRRLVEEMKRSSRSLLERSLACETEA